MKAAHPEAASCVTRSCAVSTSNWACGLLAQSAPSADAACSQHHSRRLSSTSVRRGSLDGGEGMDEGAHEGAYFAEFRA